MWCPGKPVHTVPFVSVLFLQSHLIVPSFENVIDPSLRFLVRTQMILVSVRMHII